MPRLRIVAVNDVYSLENLPRLRTLIRHHATHDPADLFLVTMAGDFLAPSILSSIDGGRGMVDCLNDLPVTHAILGNHEDDLALDDLRARLAELRAHLILTNVRGFEDRYPTSIVLSVGDARVGLVGVIDGDATLYRRPPFGGAHVGPANATAIAEADKLRAWGVPVVIAMTHQRMPDDRALAETGVFPLIVGGHDHDVRPEKIGASWVVKVPSEAVEAAIVDVELGVTPPDVRVRVEPVSQYPEDAALRAKVAHHLRRVHELESATLLLLPPGEVLSSVGTRVRQTSFGTFVCSRLRDAFEAEGCVFNGGGIRASREHREQLTFGDLKSEIPFDNEVVVARMPGRVVREAVAASRAHLPLESGGFLQVDDRMTVDAEDRLIAIDGRPIEDDRLYRIALIRNLFEGMDHVEPLVRFAKEHPELVPIATSGREPKLALVAVFSKLLWNQLGGFASIDVDHDGKVTADELMAAIARATHEPPSEVAAKLVLDALDHDHDHVVTSKDGM